MKNFIKFYLLVFFLTADFNLFAQPGDDDGGGGLEGEDPIPGAPINSQLIWLIVVGSAFALYTFRNKKQKI